MKLKVKDVVNIIENRCGKLVGGFDGLNREILYFDVMEHPDMKPWMKEGMIMVTTCYAIKDDEEALLKLIEDLNDANAAALAIKTRFFREIPECIIPLANKLNFPVFFLEDEASFIDITYPIMTAIVEVNNNENVFNDYVLYNEYKKNRDTKFFLDLINDKIIKPNEIDYKVDFLNWPRGEIRMVIVDIKAKNKRKYINKEDMKNMYDFIIEFMENNNKKYAIALKNNQFICFISNKHDKYKLKDLLINLNENIKKRFRYESNIGISEKVYNYFSIKEVYKDVEDAILIGSRLRINKKVLFIEDYKFEQLLIKLSKDENFQNFAMDKLNLLEEHDMAHESQLLDTLKAVIESRGSRTEAASNLYLHRNTLAYRVKKIEQITGYSLSDYDNLFQIEFALKIRDYI